jgi:hypothetical protein
MTNYIIYGRNKFYVNIIGHYMAGHEPGNFGLIHMALERGMITTFNPIDIPVYEWTTGKGQSLADLTDFQRYPLKTYYLQRDYNGQNEPYWHLVNEPYYYNTTGIDTLPDNSKDFYLNQNFPNPVLNATTLTFNIPGNGHVKLEIMNNNGQVIDVLVNKQLSYGEHTVSWNRRHNPSGFYICRLQFGGSSRTQKMMVLQ